MTPTSAASENFEEGALGARLSAISALEFARELSEAQRVQVAAAAELVQKERGAVLFREGELHPYLYFVQRGSVALEMAVPHKGSQRILTVGQGEVLAWSAVLGDGRMTATAIVTEPVQLIRFSAEKFSDLCIRERDIGWILMRGVAAAVAKRLVATRLQLLDLFHRELV
jgi:CRP/FNR family cyclic AMP-dependent transcriptional regulator